MTKKIYMFPGQGSQHIGMGQDLLARFATQTTSASEIAGFDIKEVCLDDIRKADLNKTSFTQPALYWINALFLLAKRQDSAIDKDAIFIGHSLGEYNALQAAEVIGLYDGLKAVSQRGRLMQDVGKKAPGAMAAILGLTAEAVAAVCDANDGLYVANFNTTGQVVVSGTTAAIDACAQAFKSAGAKRVVPLAVSGAFHSPLMEPVAKQYAQTLEGIDFVSPKWEVYSNVTAKPHSSDAGAIRKKMVEQLYCPVRWHETVLNLKSQYQLENGSFEELGPGNVLTGLVRKA